MNKSPRFNPGIVIFDYKPEYQPWFEKFNRDWIEKYFWMESIDFDVLQHPEEHIISHGGMILMASYNNEIAGTVALKFVTSGTYEFTKMAVDEKFRGLSIGRALSEVAIEKAKALGAKAIILYSNRKLETAITLYRKLGFLEVPVDSIYARADIKMRLVLDPGSGINPVFSIRRATTNDATKLCQLGKVTFWETFAEHNTAEDMELYLQKNFNVDQLEKEIEDPASIFLIAFDGDVEIGFAKIRTNNVTPDGIASTNAIELERIYISRKYVGKRAGHELLQACIDLAKHQKFDTIWLGVWEHNARAITFYEKYKFEKFSRHDFILGNDIQTDLLMKKNLTE